MALDSNIIGALGVAKTEVRPVDKSAQGFRLTVAPTAVRAVDKNLKKSVDGVIASYDDVSVNCELRLSDKSVSVQLPRALFPDQIRYGLPVSVEMSDVEGIRRLVVTLRKFEPSANSAIAKEFDMILDQL